ncbi:MAG TPA: hypothetical protein VFA59_16825 [Vicinamibacterales bacterium]|nr:hypothetical protein [Vicinamibacterales bacterium]
MPIDLSRDDTRRQFTATVHGSLTFHEAADFIRTVRVGEFQPYALLFDMTDATFELSSDQVRSLAAMIGTDLTRSGLRGRTAVVASDDLTFGMLRMFDAHVEHAGIATLSVFRTVAEAQSWLGG